MTQVVFNPMNLAPQSAAKPSGRAAESDFADRLATASGQAGRPTDAKRAARPEASQPAPPEKSAAATSDDKEAGEDQQSLEGEPSAEAASLAGAEATNTAAEQDQIELSDEALLSEAEAAKGDAQEESETSDSPVVPEEPVEEQQSSLLNAQASAEGGEENADQTGPLTRVEKPASTEIQTEAASLAGEVAVTQAATPRAAALAGEAEPESTDSSKAVEQSTTVTQALEQPGAAMRSGERQSQNEGDQSASTQGQQPAVASAAQNDLVVDATMVEEASTDAPPETRATPAAKAEAPAMQDTLPSSTEKGVAGRASATSAGEAPGVSQGERVDAARFIGRVGRAFETAHQRGDVVRIRLSPPELGAMQIKLAVSAEGAMTASVETETSAARNLLLDNLPALRERLAGMEIRVEKFDVDVRRDGGGQQDHWHRGDGEAKRENQGRAPGQNTRPQPLAAAGAERITPHAGPVGADQINLVI